MNEPGENLPLSTVTLIFGALSVPLAFAAHLVSLALVLGVLAVTFGLWGRSRQAMDKARYSTRSVRRAGRGLLLGAVGVVCACVMWVLWATNVLL